MEEINVSKTPSIVLKEFYERIPSYEKATFFTSIICGLLAHLYHFTNKQFNSDEIGFTPSGVGGGTDLGRWGLQFLGDSIDKVFGTYSIPLFSGLLTLLLITMSACIFVELFEIKDSLLASLIGAIFVTFPVLTSIYYFMFTAPSYALALLLSIWSVYIYSKPRKSFINKIISIAMLTFSIGIYQAYFAVAVCAILMLLIIWCMKDDTLNPIKFFKKCLQDLFYLSISMGFYFIIHKIVLSISGMTMVSHRGLDQMGQQEIGAYLKAVLLCYQDWWLIFCHEFHSINPTPICRLCIILLNIIGFLYIARSIFAKKKSTFQITVIFILLMLMPIAEFLAHVMAYPSDIYSLMIYSSIFTIIFPMLLCGNKVNNDWKGEWSTRIETVADWVVPIASGICVLIFIWHANGSYMSLQYTNYQDLSYYQTLVTQIKELDGYNDDLPLMIKGSSLDDHSITDDSEMQQKFNMDGRTPTNIMSWNHERLIKEFIGYQPRLIWDFQISDELTDPSNFETHVADMPNYPDDGSIQIVEGIIVVKFSD